MLPAILQMQREVFILLDVPGSKQIPERAAPHLCQLKSTTLWIQLMAAKVVCFDCKLRLEKEISLCPLANPGKRGAFRECSLCPP